jgi:ethanolamine ammonia-lyase small subunit
MKPPVPDRHDLLATLRSRTPARVALGHAGAGLPTAALLAFQLDHARARDAVHEALEVPRLTADLASTQVLQVRSQAPDRNTYLQRPDLGRRLAPESLATLRGGPFDVVFVIGDGLSARAVQAHAAPTLHALLQALPDWNVAPLIIATQARVALGDDIGVRLNAQLCVMLIGERPGLSAPDSLGIYLTWKPAPGRRDHERNCISNIRPPQGLSYEEAAARAAWLMRAARRSGCTGVGLKDDSEIPAALPPT